MSCRPSIEKNNEREGTRLPYIEFESKYRTFTIMDREHQQLISIINRFYDEWVMKKTVNPFSYLLELVEYGANQSM